MCRRWWRRGLHAKRSLDVPGGYLFYQRSEAGYESVLYFRLHRPLSEVERSLLRLFCANVALTYQNLLVIEDTVESQHEMAYMLGEAVETTQQGDSASMCVASRAVR
jgi:hypothetical protein